MTEFDFEALILPAIPLGLIEGVPIRFFGGEPRSKHGRGVEGGLKIAENLEGGDVGRLVDCLGKGNWGVSRLSFTDIRRKWITPSPQDADSKHAIGVDMDLRYLTENELTEDALHNFGHDGLEAI